jgi:glucose/arabinose dehydrogenase
MGKLLLWIGLFLAACLSAQTISLENFVSGISNPVEIVASPTSDNRLFVVQQSGTIKIVNENGTIAPDNFLNISNLITFGGERGLLGLAFHPQFLTNRYFFVYYNNLQGSIRVSRFTANSSNPNTADVSSKKFF